MPLLVPLLLLSLQLPPVQEPPRLRTLLPNGAAVLVDRHPGASTLTIHLFISSRSTPETPQTHGLRHLLEHLEAKGRNREIDQQLETRGGYLTAETLRDATAYTVKVQPQDLALGIRAISSVIQLGAVSKDDIAREAEIIRQEQALETRAEKASAVAWTEAYSADGLDPSGDADTISQATPEELSALHKAEFTGPNLVLVVSGDIDVNAATAAASACLGSAPAVPAISAKMRVREADPKVEDGPAQAVAVCVSDFNAAPTAARLAAAFGIAGQFDGAFVTYTPSQRGGLILVGSASDPSWTERLPLLKAAALFSVGRSRARRWVEQQIGPDSDGFLRGLLLVQGGGLRPETMLDDLNAITPPDFAAAVAEFQSPTAIKVVRQ